MERMNRRQVEGVTWSPLVAEGKEQEWVLRVLGTLNVLMQDLE